MAPWQPVNRFQAEEPAMERMQTVTESPRFCRLALTGAAVSDSGISGAEIEAAP